MLLRGNSVKKKTDPHDHPYALLTILCNPMIFIINWLKMGNACKRRYLPDSSFYFPTHDS